MARVRVELPEHFDQDASVIEAKGWLDGTVVDVDGVEHRPLFYDPVRLSQEITDALATDGFLYERELIVIPSVTREHVERAAARIYSG